MTGKKYSIIFFFIFIALKGFPQFEYQDKIYKENIKTVMFYRAGWEFTYPVLELHSGKQLILEFDDLNKSHADYYYTFIHCSSNWQPSDLNPIEYINGFEENQIDNYENSFGTLIPYVHYTLALPNENAAPLISGNYLLLVYEDYDKNKPVLSQRFYVVDTKVDIDASVQRSTLVGDMRTSQELRVNVKDKKNSISNPQDAFSMSVIQNNNPHLSVSGLHPDFIKGNLYEFYNPRKLKFKGGYEFRHVNFKSTKYVYNKINAIHFNRPYYMFELVNEKCENTLTYSYQQDINGEYLIRAEHVDNPSLEADYVLADFYLYKKTPFIKGNVYVYGAISNHEITEANKMNYDYDTKRYHLRMLLKQGFYNYQYVLCNPGGHIPQTDKTEGNYYQTENNYSIFLYNRPQGGQYDELIGYKILNSVKVF